MKTTGSKSRWMVAAVAAAAALVLATLPADAHVNTMAFKNWVRREMTTPGQCVKGAAFTNHDQRSITTTAYKEASTPFTVDFVIPGVPAPFTLTPDKTLYCNVKHKLAAGDIHHFYWVYKDGGGATKQPCYMSPDYRNNGTPGRSDSVRNIDDVPRNFDLPGCNNGPGKAWVTIDTFHGIRSIYHGIPQGDLIEGWLARPAVAHCYNCPT